MMATPKTKLCWNCEGSAPVEEENCPYCGVYLGPGSESDEGDLLAPPYRIHDQQTEEDILDSPYAPEEEPELRDYEQPEEEEGDMQSTITPLLLLLGGAVFLLFGLVLALFSQHGVFTLQWNGEYWYVYLLLAVPMLFFGWRSLQTLEGEA